ncbi:protein ABIL3-like isoform X2 [Syzygium oleosum]|uniref:protein ABIL3-like isoform X2 n=1 Tax=Syzygium oleosum TaxID=219896 RepID=UPI0024BA918D|nr:protein ABIL3-like isoform X2 [Syzygium oleosum]
MDASQLPSSVSAPQEASHYDELSMKQSLNFSDSLKDLKDLRKQLYSAADSFELSYNRHDQKQTVVKTLRDYATKVFINTVDHLGSMIYKVKCLLEDKIEEASAIELRFSCVRQRLRMCEMFIDRGGLSQRSLVIRTPKHHMRYILPGTLPFTRFVIGLLRPRVRNRLMLKNFLSVSTAKDGGASKNLRYHMTSGVNAEMSAGEHGDGIRLHSFHNPPQPAPFHLQALHPTKNQYPSEPRRSTSMSTHVERSRRTDIEVYSSKNKRLLKALLSMRKLRKDNKLYKFLDDY